MRRERNWIEIFEDTLELSGVDVVDRSEGAQGYLFHTVYKGVNAGIWPISYELAATPLSLAMYFGMERADQAKAAAERRMAND